MADSSLTFNIIGRDKTGPAFSSAGSNVEKLAGRLKGAFALGAVFAGVKTVGDMLGGLVSDARESAKVAAISAQVVKTTGGAANITAAQMGSLATSLSNKTGADDEAIQSGENLLATFTGIRNEVGKGNDIFNQTSQATIDMTAAMNDGKVTTEGLKSSSIMLGKALNDPAAGVAKLTKVGVTFNAQQKAQIKAMAASGNTIGAQKVMLKELAKEFGGVAAASTTPAQKATVAWGNLREQLGGYLLPVVDKVATLLTSKVLPAVSKFFNNVQSGGGKFAAFRNAIKTAFEFIKTDVIPTLGRLASFFMQQVWPALKKNAQIVIQSFLPVIKQLGATIKTQLWPAVQQLIKAFQVAFPVVRKLVTILLTVAGYIVRTVLPPLIKLEGFIYGTLIRTVAKLITIIAKIVGTLINWGHALGVAGAAVGHFAAAVGSAFMSAYHAVTSAIGKAISAVKAFPGHAVSALGNLASSLYQYGIDFIQGFINGVLDKAKALPGVIKDKVVGVAKSALHLGGLFGSPSRLTMKYGKWWTEGFAIGIKMKKQDVLDAAKTMLDDLKTKLQTVKDFAGQIKDAFVSGGDLSGIDSQYGLNYQLGQLRDTASTDTKFTSGIAALRKMGLNETTLGQLRDAGPGSYGTVSNLLGGGAGGISETNRLTKLIGRTGGKFGDAEALAQYGIDPSKKQKITIGSGKTTVHLTIDSKGNAEDAILAVLRKSIRAKGGNVQVVLGKGK